VVLYSDRVNVVAVDLDAGQLVSTNFHRDFLLRWP